jgi:predicted nucleic acid-binding protein
MELVLDSNVLIYFLSGRLNADSTELIENILSDRSGFISHISYLECLAISADRKEEIANMQAILHGLNIVRISDGIIEDAVVICQIYKLKPHAGIISATALALRVPVISNDLRGFHRVKGLEVKRFQLK